MRTVTIKKFHQDMWEEIKDLPVTVTRYGKPHLLVDLIPSGQSPKKIEFKAKPKKVEGIICNIGLCNEEAVSQRKDGKWVCEEHK